MGQGVAVHINGCVGPTCSVVWLHTNVKAERDPGVHRVYQSCNSICSSELQPSLPAEGIRHIVLWEAEETKKKRLFTILNDRKMFRFDSTAKCYTTNVLPHPPIGLHTITVGGLPVYYMCVYVHCARV